MMIKKFLNKVLKRLPITFLIKVEKLSDDIVSIKLFDIR